MLRALQNLPFDHELLFGSHDLVGYQHTSPSNFLQNHPRGPKIISRLKWLQQFTMNVTSDCNLAILPTHMPRFPQHL